MAEFARSRIGVATYLAPPGPLTDAAAVAELRDMMLSCLASNEVHLVLDFGSVTLVGSAALEALLETQERLTRAGGGLKITDANAAVSDVLALTGVSDFITLINSGEQEPGRAPLAPARRAGHRARLGELLLERGLVTPQVITQAVELQQQSGRRLGHVLVDRGWVKERDLLAVLSEQLGLPLVHLRTGLFDPEVVRQIKAGTLRKLNVVPLFKVRGHVFLATADPQAIPSFDMVEELTGAKVKPVLACGDDIMAAVNDAFAEDHDLSEYIGELDADDGLELIEHGGRADYTTIDEMASGSPVINLVNGLIQRAVRDGASDIHIEPSRNLCRIRFRIDGVLYQAMSPPSDVHPALVSRLKVMANMDIAERRLPQDGRIQVYTQGRTIDLRFSSLPGIYGEKVVLRVLDKTESITDIGKLGMNAANLALFKRLLDHSHGLVLATGPTGSGKTTTLYAAISHLNSIEKSIVTIEDPVEYQLDVINQNQVKEGIGLGFARLLRHVLRQDPDIVMVGEIRDQETAQIAVQAALTGHLVLSTLHTNDSTGAITRLLDMGVEPFLLSSALIGVVAQRLVRTICRDCKTDYVAPPGSLTRFGIDASKHVQLARGRGCTACYDSGYKGRIAIHELLETDSETQTLMLSNPSRDALATHVKARGVKTLLHDGLGRVLERRTTIEELSRVVS